MKPPPPSPRRPEGDSVALRLGRAVLSYPIPLGAAAGLALGGSLLYLASAPVLGKWVWFATLVAGGIPLVVATVRRILSGRLASDVIASMAIVGAIVLDQAFAGVVIVLMQSGGEALERYAFHRATSSLEELLRRAPRTAWRRRGDRVEEVPVSTVVPGDVVTVRAGDLVPVDGEVAGSAALLDESAVTGEPLPRRRPAGETVLSGTANVGDAFDLRAVRPSRESQYERMVELVRRAQDRKPEIQRVADRFAVWFTPITVIVAVLAALVNHSAVAALAVLVVATPCPLILATPVAIVASIDRAADQGLLAKSGAAMEEMGRTRAVLFDKTGTLTVGRPELEAIVPFADGPVDDLLRRAAGLEQLSSHPIAQAVVREARGRGLVLPRVENPREFPGEGLAGTIEGRRVVVGSPALVTAESRQSLEREQAVLATVVPLEGHLVAFVAADQVPLGALVFADRLRPEAEGLGPRLKQLGVRHVGLVTGDTRSNAEEVGRRAGVDSVDAELLPEMKVARVGEIRRAFGSTMMVGDGINDAAALAAASTGVAMGAHGAGISAEAADAVLLVDDLNRVVDGIALGQRMLRTVRQGIWFGLGASVVLMGFASVGLIAPAVGAVLQEGIDAAVIVNALRVRWGAFSAARG
jgi:heavy metal translocating P-type ATPase